MTTTALTSPPAGLPLRIALWAAQILVAVAFLGAGIVKNTQPLNELAVKMPWVGEAPAWFVHLVGCIDIAGGLGILLPALTRIAPRLTVWAAAGCAALQVCAGVFHLSRGEAQVLPLNVVLLAASLFVLWGRSRRAPVLPRG